MIKGIIFDLDGTLLNTIDDMNNSVNDTYAYFGYKKRNTVPETMSMVGHGMKNLIIQCFPGKDEEFILKALDVFLNFYDKQYYKITAPYPGVVDMVNGLIEKGYKVGVNSNKNHNYTRHLIELNFPNIDQDYVTGVRPGDATKPDPANVNRVIKTMGLTKDQILYVGDSPTDFQTSQNAGTRFCGVSWGFRSKEKIMAAGAGKVVDTAEELSAYCEGENEI